MADLMAVNVLGLPRGIGFGLCLTAMYAVMLAAAAYAQLPAAKTTFTSIFMLMAGMLSNAIPLIRSSQGVAISIGQPEDAFSLYSTTSLGSSAQATPTRTTNKCSSLACTATSIYIN